MSDQPALRRETRYGMPAADQVLFNRHYVLGYSYYFRQAKWALEIVNPLVVDDDGEEEERQDHFRPDYRLPEQFRADLVDYTGSGFDRGHLVSSANQIDTEIQNSETFLLSNMSPQAPQFNRGIWRKLESAIRTLNDRPSILETYVICGPIFYFDQPVALIGDDDDNEVSIPIPNAYFKSVLTEDHRGKLAMYSFMLDNEASSDDLENFMVETEKVEQYAGIELWSELTGTKIRREKGRIRKMWDH